MKTIRSSETWLWLRRVTQKLRTRPLRQLRLCETLPLGERRFLAVVQFEEQKFLIGGTGSSIALLAQLDSHETSLPEKTRQYAASTAN